MAKKLLHPLKPDILKLADIFIKTGILNSFTDIDFSLIFESVAGICDRNFDRNFWQHDGDPLGPKCSDTRFSEIV